MKTINTVLPIYDKIAKQCYQRANNNQTGQDKPITIVTPRHRLPSILWKAPDIAKDYLQHIYLVNASTGAETDITAYFLTSRILKYGSSPLPYADLPLNSGYDSFTSYAGDPTKFTAVKTTAAGVAYVYSDDFAVTAGETIMIRTWITLNSGSNPEVVVVSAAGDDISNIGYVITTANTYVTLTITTSDTNARIRFRNTDTQLSNYTMLFYVFRSAMFKMFKIGTDKYYQYSGETLGIPLPVGLYYLRIVPTMNPVTIFYSEIFKVDCVYTDLIQEWTNSIDSPFDTTFWTSGGSIIEAEQLAPMQPECYGEDFSVIQGEEIIVNIYVNYIDTPSLDTDRPSIYLDTPSVTTVALNQGLNVVTLTSDMTGTTRIKIIGTGACHFSTYEVLAFRSYSEKYLIFNFSNTCDLGDYIYQEGFDQTAWIESETMENTYPQEEEGQKNGEGRFVRTFARQVKKYLARTNAMPAYMVDVFNRMKLHDTVEIIDLVGDVSDVYNLEVEQEWLFDDKYYAKMDLTFDYNEAAIIAACCTNR